MNRKISDDALEELEGITKRIEILEDALHARLKQIAGLEQKILVRYETNDYQTCVRIHLINLNRVIAEYLFRAEENNLIRIKSNLSHTNTNGKREDVKPYLSKLEAALQKEYNCSFEIYDMVN